jgi:hypothetical protein
MPSTANMAFFLTFPTRLILVIAIALQLAFPHSFAKKDRNEDVVNEFFHQGGHTNNWAVLV